MSEQSEERPEDIWDDVNTNLRASSQASSKSSTDGYDERQCRVMKGDIHRTKQDRRKNTGKKREVEGLMVL